MSITFLIFTYLPISTVLVFDLLTSLFSKYNQRISYRPIEELCRKVHRYMGTSIFLYVNLLLFIV